MNRKIFVLILLFASLFCLNQQSSGRNVEQWGVYEIVLKGPSVGNPFLEIELTAVFSARGEEIKVPGFYDGEGVYRIRFSPPKKGTWRYTTLSNSNELSGKKGRFRCISPSGYNHGPVRVVKTFYLQYTDGTPFYSVGTTAYQWTSVKQSIQEQTIKTLSVAPFNKIRMCVFPKSYQYGNDTEPWLYPFKREGKQNDLTQPVYEFFRNFDTRVSQLMEMGIEADVILFHPYDSWGYSKMGKEMNERYVRYMIARIGAYRNVWWSLANEWDVTSIKNSIDWEGIGTLLQREDPSGHLRGIHNWYGSEDHFFDHSRPWITHVSAQTSQFYNAVKWRNQYKKPLLFDEMRYEGDVPSGWGKLKAEEMTSYFWMAGLSGGYGTHGDTFRNDSDNGTEVRWWAKGGTLPGKSPERIRFFREVMEKAPVTEMTPVLVSETNPASLNRNIYIFSKEGEYYLTYTSEKDRTIEINLTGSNSYKLEVIDTWNMKIVEEKIVKPGIFNYKTDLPYTTLRFICEKNAN